MPVHFEKLAASLSESGSKPKSKDGGLTVKNGTNVKDGEAVTAAAGAYARASAAAINGHVDLMNADKVPNVGTVADAFYNIDDPAWDNTNWTNDDINLILPPVSAIQSQLHPEKCMSDCMQKKVDRESKCAIVRQRVEFALNQAGCSSRILRGPGLGTCGQPASGCSTCAVASSVPGNCPNGVVSTAPEFCVGTVNDALKPSLSSVKCVSSHGMYGPDTKCGPVQRPTMEPYTMYDTKCGPLQRPTMEPYTMYGANECGPLPYRDQVHVFYDTEEDLQAASGVGPGAVVVYEEPEVIPMPMTDVVVYDRNSVVFQPPSAPSGGVPGQARSASVACGGDINVPRPVERKILGGRKARGQLSRVRYESNLDNHRKRLCTSANYDHRLVEGASADYDLRELGGIPAPSPIVHLIEADCQPPVAMGGS